MEHLDRARQLVDLAERNLERFAQRLVGELIKDSLRLVDRNGLASHEVVSLEIWLLGLLI